MKNLSASIIRSPTIMSGTGWTGTYKNLSNNTNDDVTFPYNHTTTNSLNDLNTSLWSYSANNPNNASPNGITINMQAYDTGFTGTGNYYYAIRIDTDSTLLYYGNIRISSVNFN